jgi:hypothetical protein
MLELVAAHADWWNLPSNVIGRLEGLRGAAGAARVSLQQIVAFVGKDDDRDEVAATAKRRFGWAAGDGLALGAGPELVEHFGTLAGRGVERFYTWFTDFAPPDTIAAFGADVIGAM